MKKRKQIAFNKLFNVCIALGVFFLCASVGFFKINDFAWGVGVGIAAFLLIVLPSVFSPCCYLFASDGISLCYVFLPKERFLWKDIYAIEVDDITISVRNSNIFDFFYASVFTLKGDKSVNRRFFDEVHIRKSFRTKYLLEKYWDGTITGYMFEDAKNWINKRRAKKKAYVNAHFTDEIVKMEREARAKARECLKPFSEEAKRNNLEVKPKYFYVTKDFKTLKSRPQEGYTYTLDVEISHLGETDENKILVLQVDLLYVKFGKNSYIGTENKDFEEKLKLEISDVLAEINNEF